MYQHDPWKMLMVCMMLNQTSYKQVDKVRNDFFDAFPDAERLANAREEDIINIIKPLGFYNRRAALWKKFSSAWLSWNKENVMDLPGVGKYASDSWKIFQEFNYNVQVEDKELKRYLQWINESGYNK